VAVVAVVDVAAVVAVVPVSASRHQRYYASSCRIDLRDTDQCSVVTVAVKVI